MTEYAITIQRADDDIPTGYSTVGTFQAEALDGHDVLVKALRWWDHDMDEGPEGHYTMPEDYHIGDGRHELKVLDREGISFTDAVTSNINPEDEGAPDGHMTILLDWAAELRRLENLTWAQAIAAAGILYFG